MDYVAVEGMWETYEALVDWVPGAIVRDGQVQRYYYSRLGISRRTFARRMKEGGWTVRELRVLIGMFRERQIPRRSQSETGEGCNK